MIDQVADSLRQQLYGTWAHPARVPKFRDSPAIRVLRDWVGRQVNVRDRHVVVQFVKERRSAPTARPILDRA
jgi:hypothetical protein